MTEFDRSLIAQFPLGERHNKVHICQSVIHSCDEAPAVSDEAREVISGIASSIISARSRGASVMLAFGAHAIKNCLGPLMVEFLQRGWITHLATNGAGIIHDWEFSFIGESSESVADNLPQGRFGIWQETGSYLNLAIIAGAYEGLGYGAAVGKAITRQGLDIPSQDELTDVIRNCPDLEKKAAAADFLGAVREAGLPAGWLPIPAPYGEYSLQAGAWKLGVASTDHPMFGHDIIYTHRLNCGSAIGRTAERDFKSFEDSFSRLNDGVYLSVGSAIMSPMVFQKMSERMTVHGHHIAVVDLAEEKQFASYTAIFKESLPAAFDYLQMDNRSFLMNLFKALASHE